MTQMTAFEDRILSGVSQLIPSEGFVSEDILTPYYNATAFTGSIAKYGNEHLRIQKNITGARTGYLEVKANSRATDTFKIISHGLKQVISPEDYANVKKPFDAEKEAVLFMTLRMLIEKEVGLASVLTDTSVITNNTTLSGTDQWNDEDNSDPKGDATIARASIRGLVGLYPDLVVMSPEVAEQLRKHPAVLDTLKYTIAVQGGATDADLAKYLGVERLLIASAIYNSSVEGQADNIVPIWGKDVLFCISPKRSALMQKSLGYDIRLGGEKSRKVTKEVLSEPMSYFGLSPKMIRVADAYAHAITDVNCAYLIKDAVA
jgi:hypothetical protein